MVARVRTNRVFSGKMYGKSRPNSCKVRVEKKLDFQLYLGYNDLGYNDLGYNDLGYDGLYYNELGYNKFG